MTLRPTPFRARRGARLLLRAAALALATASVWSGPALADHGDVLVTVRPVHGLVAAVMEGTGRPLLLLEGAATPHLYALRPSQARALRHARLIVWVGPELEGFLVRPLRAMAGSVRIVTLLDVPGMKVLPAAEGGRDPHLWLDADNARAIVRVAAETLAEMEPADGSRYAANASRAMAAIAALDRALDRRLAPVRELPFLVAHDAYRYFTARYGLAAVGAVASSPERQPGARRLAELRRVVREHDVRCLLTEPGFEPALARALADEVGARTGVLDPLGVGAAAGPGAWFEMMRANATALLDCLRGNG